MKKAFLYFELFTVAALFIMGVGDLLFFAKGGASQTLSYSFWMLSKQWPIIPFILGFLAGHLVWQYDPDFLKPTQKKSENTTV